MEVIRPGAEVTVQGIKGHIHDVYIGLGNTIRYNFVYWDGNDRKSETIVPSEVDYTNDTRKIGFVSDPQ